MELDEASHRVQRSTVWHQGRVRQRSVRAGCELKGGGEVGGLLAGGVQEDATSLDGADVHIRYESSIRTCMRKPNDSATAQRKAPAKATHIRMRTSD